MPFRLKVFEWLIYLAVAIDVVDVAMNVRTDTSKDSLFSLTMDAVLIALAWAAARRAKAWAAIVLGVIGLIGVGSAIVGAKGDVVMRDSAIVVVAINSVLLLIAVGFYFAADRKTA